MILPSTTVRHDDHGTSYERDGDWRDRAGCVDADPELFYTPGLEQEAKAVCQGCSVVNQCLEANLEDTWGILGNTTPDERHQIRRKRTPPTIKDDCGSINGYWRHIKAKESTDAACRAALRAHKDQRREEIMAELAEAAS